MLGDASNTQLAWDVGRKYLDQSCLSWSKQRHVLLFFLHVAGAFGYFEVTHDITRFSKAKVFEHVGKTTPVAVRFSTVGKNNLQMCLSTLTFFFFFIMGYIFLELFLR